MKILLKELRKVIREILEDDVEERIEELQGDPAFTSVEAFVESKLENDEYEYDFAELQALARNEMHASMGGKRLHISSPSQSVVNRIRGELDGMGFKFVGRAPLKTVRGVGSPSHGTHPFAGSGGGGSGMGSGIDGPIGFGIGGGPGAMGGGYKWDASSKRDLPMGSRRR